MDRTLIVYFIALQFSTSSIAQEKEATSYEYLDHKRLNKSIEYYNDLYLNFTQLADKDGYLSEQHTVITEDGYVLTLHRIISKCSNTIGYPVVLMHGIFDSSDVWIFTGPNEALGYMLADNCYDVWAANSRGNVYSRKHIRLNPDRDKQFWNYSFDESGVYDLPAVIDYVLNVTNKKRIYYVGNSQGTTSFFVLASLKPEYNSKIHLSIQLAPVVWLKYVGPLLNFVASRSYFLLDVFKKFGVTEILGRHQLIRQIASLTCQIKPYEICGILLNLVTGEKVENLSQRRITQGIGHSFAGASVKSFNHYAQLILSQNFQRYDEGKEGNQRRYGEDNPPKYNLSLVTSPVVLMCGQNDKLSDLRNIKILSSVLPNLVEVYIVPDPTWSHPDYLWNNKAVINVYLKILRYLKTYNN